MLADLFQYVGQTDSKGKPHGHGTMVYKTNGDKYEGDWIHGLQQGFGQLTSGIYSSVYIGEWFRGKKHGIGSCTYPSGEVYSGQFIEDEIQGKGAMFYANGDYYWGDMSRAIRHGIGMLRYADGRFYEGDWCNDLKHGYGKLTEKDLCQYYWGYWVKDVQQGRGTLAKFHPYTHSLTTYEGQFLQGQLQGRGFMSDVHGGTYRGDFVDGERHGGGIMYQPSGAMYQGSFRHDLFNRGVAKLENGTNISGKFFNLLPDGFAAVDYQNGSYYQGNMTSGFRQGKGELHSMDGVTLETEFRDDQPDGRGKLRFKDGSEYTSLFVKGKEVMEVEDPKRKAEPPPIDRFQ